MRRWERPYTLDVATGTAIIGLVGIIGFAAFLAVLYARGEIPTPLAILSAVSLGGGLAIAARRATLGVFVSDYGVRSRMLLRTVTVPWKSISDIRSREATMAGLDMGRDAIFLIRTDGLPVQTPLQRGDFFRPFTRRPELGRLATTPEHYDEILATLRLRLADARQRREPMAVPDHRPAGPTATGPPAAPRATAHRAAGAAAPADRRPANPRLHVLARLHARGVLSDAEFAAERAKLDA